jgi:hypothetical protein
MKTFVVAALLALAAVSGAVVVSEIAVAQGGDGGPSVADGCLGNCGNGR